MKFLKRFLYFFIGVGLGLLLVKFFFGGRDIQCSYFPNDRVLHDIRQKELGFSTQAECMVACLELDSIKMEAILNRGKVEFSKSNTKSEPCKTYLILGETSEFSLEATIENCDSTATFHSIELLKGNIDCSCEN